VNLAVREAGEPDSEHRERKLRLAVVLERLAAAVSSVTVGFDRNSLCSPQEVDREAGGSYLPAAGPSAGPRGETEQLQSGLSGFHFP
jgi:hypothetical protein